MISSQPQVSKGFISWHFDSTLDSTTANYYTASLNEAASESESRTIGIQHRAKCGCPEKVLHSLSTVAKFHGLEFREKYFPMVSRAEPLAFFGPPPAGVTPRQAKASTMLEVGNDIHGFAKDFNDFLPGAVLESDLWSSMDGAFDHTTKEQLRQRSTEIFKSLPKPLSLLRNETRVC